MLRIFSKFRKSPDTDLTSEVEELRNTRGEFRDSMVALQELAQRGVKAVEDERDLARDQVQSLNQDLVRTLETIRELEAQVAELKNKDKREDVLMTAIVSARDILNEIV